MTLIVDGNLTITNASAIKLDFNVSIAVSGCITITGGSLTVLVTPEQNGQSVTLLTSSQGCLSGEFGSVVVNSTEACLNASAYPTYTQADLRVVVEITESNEDGCNNTTSDITAKQGGIVAGVIIFVALVAAGVATGVKYTKQRKEQMQLKSTLAKLSTNPDK